MNLFGKSKHTEKQEMAQKAYEVAISQAKKTSRSACEVRSAVDIIIQSGQEAIHEFLTGITGEGSRNVGDKQDF